jgi:hypothetical protein
LLIVTSFYHEEGKDVLKSMYYHTFKVYPCYSFHNVRDISSLYCRLDSNSLVTLQQVENATGQKKLYNVLIPLGSSYSSSPEEVQHKHEADIIKK